MTQLCVIGALLALLTGCTPEFDNPLDPENPSNFTLWHQALSAPLPDTLYYGATAVFVVNIGDRDGDAVSVTASGLPAGQLPAVFPSGEATSVSFRLTGDSLAFDSTYAITLHASGGEPPDTLTLRYALRVADSTRLGGVKKLRVGMWWTETAYDTTDFANRDSSGVDTSGTVLAEHRLGGIVVDTLKRNGELFYVIQTTDTIVGAGVTLADTVLFRHTALEVSHVTPPDSGSDTLFLRFLSLPLFIGQRWSALDMTRDTVRSFALWGIPYDIRFVETDRAAGEVADTARFSFGGHDYPCFNLESTDTLLGLIAAHGDLIHPVNLTVVADSGDTIQFSRAEAAGRTFFSSTLTVPLRARTVKNGFDSTYLDRTSYRYAYRRETFLTSYYDPWRDTVLTQ